MSEYVTLSKIKSLNNLKKASIPLFKEYNGIFNFDCFKTDYSECIAVRNITSKRFLIVTSPVMKITSIPNTSSFKIETFNSIYKLDYPNTLCAGYNQVYQHMIDTYQI